MKRKNIKKLKADKSRQQVVRMITYAMEMNGKITVKPIIMYNYYMLMRRLKMNVNIIKLKLGLIKNTPT